jgi:hypothetical protein
MDLRLVLPVQKQNCESALARSSPKTSSASRGVSPLRCRLTAGWLRQDIIWHKTNPMPESVTDRCTKAHEYVFLLTKSERYFYDAEAVSEAQVTSGEGGFSNKATLKSVVLGASHKKPSLLNATNDGRRNRRSVWTISTKPYSGAHFAVMPARSG